MAVRPDFWRIERYGTVSSTMDIANERARAGACAGLVVVAEEQISGRGQFQRTWVAPYGRCLLFTVLLRPPLPVAQSPTLSHDLAEKVAEAISDVTGLHADIKAPNDVLIRGRKVSGILPTTSIRGDQLEHLLIGIGLNVNLSEDELPLPTATSLLVETRREWDRDDVLWGILDRLSEIPDLVG